ncbi:spore maturation protein [Phaeospirillum tilakii]|uniref:Nucleoside recognition domain-containing protein n=1 Tax=Phaeospirillum tilakii TaxID=741673 RepID=A0ABW5C7M6_9PROT
MNRVFVALVAVSFLFAAAGGEAAMQKLSTGLVEGAAAAVPLAFGLIGIMALFLGVMKVAEAAGLLDALARLLRPVLTRLFPELPADHPAFGAMALNLAANLLGLGNAATPFGLRAMQQLERANPHPGTASNAQVLFLALNTAGITLLPAKVIALRASAGAADPAAVVGPTLAASLTALVVAVIAAKLLQRLVPPPIALPAPPPSDAPLAPLLLTLAGLAGLAAALLAWGSTVGPWLLPSLVAGILLYGAARRVPVYESFVAGARGGFAVAIRILPYLVAILAAIAMLRASGALEALLTPLGHLTAPLGLPAEALMMAVLRTLSGSGSYGLLADAMKTPGIGPDSPLGLLLGTLYGSTETTFYVLAVYFGAVGLKRIRHALAVGLIADTAALVAAVLACR